MRRTPLLALLLLLLAPACPRAETVTLLGGHYRVEVPPGLIVQDLSPPGALAQRAVFVRPGLRAALAGLGIGPEDPELAPLLPEGAAAADLRGRIFLARLRPTLRDAGMTPLARFLRDCAVFLAGAPALRHWDAARAIGQCAEPVPGGRFVICLYARSDTVCGGGQDAVEALALRRDPGFAADLARWTATATAPEAAAGPGRAEAEEALLRRLGLSALAKTVEALLVGLQPVAP